jgi:hypothetical protein
VKDAAACQAAGGKDLPPRPPLRREVGLLPLRARA